MVMKKDAVRGLAHESMPSFLRQRERTLYLDKWYRGQPIEGEGPYRPRHAEINDEYVDLAERSPTPWLRLVVGSTAQAIFLEGVRASGSSENLEAWSTWQENGMDAKQGSLYRAVLAHGLAYATALPGESRFGGGRTARYRAFSAKTFAAFYDYDEDEDYPVFGMHCEPYATKTPTGIEEGFLVRLIDEDAIHYLECRGEGTDLKDWRYISYDEHGLRVAPIVRYHNLLDLEGQSVGEVEPLIPLAKRIDQDTFDRLIVQRFGAWKVRYIAGMAKPTTEQQATLQAMRLQVQDILISTNDQTKFGTLEETQLAGFIAARDADIRDFAAISQTPPHYLLGSLINLSAEALAAAEASLMRKITERKIGFGESHEHLMRLGAFIKGNTTEARAFDLEVRWRDMESRSMAQAADALGKLVTMVGVPPEMAFEMVPTWTDTDVARAKELVESGRIDALIATLEGQAAPGAPAPEVQP